MFVHPELVDVLATMPELPADPYRDIAAKRAGFQAAMSRLPLDTSRVEITRTTIDGPDGNAIPIELYRPRGATGPLPAVLHFHGGGFIYGRSVPGEDRTAVAIAEQVGAVGISVDYRLAPEDPYPAGLEDCYAALVWTAGHAAGLGIDPARIAVTGKSAGGGLSAAVSLLARDRGGPAIAYQSLYIPTVDDRGATPSARTITDARFPINSASMGRSYDLYLPDRTNVPPYAAPARCADLSGLPPAYVLVCGLDPLRDEGVDYARRLMDADVPVTLHNVPGAWHLFELRAPDSTPARQAAAHWLGHLRAALTI